ncbi:MAG: hypothetical protein DMF64_18930 [Acidobacteria bacterium]|nr:MAG: hypothetical protein DMF64_18930 [Acidobacteriota bacterium]
MPPGIVYRFPTNLSMTEVTQEYMIEREKLLGIQIAPFEEFMTQEVEWDELDAERGMTAPHNMRSDPKIDRRPGSKLRKYSAIPFKETDVVQEEELLRARQYGSLYGVVDLHWIIARIMKARVDKTFLRAEWCIWSMFRGLLDINENGVRVHETFPVQTFDSAVDWDQFVTATPLADDMAVALRFAGTGASAKGAKAYCNQATLNMRLKNRNEDDLYGLRKNATSVVFGLKEMNELLDERGLATYEVYDEGFNDDDGDFERWLEDDEVVVIGKRPQGQKVAGFAMTPSLHLIKNGMQAPGFFSILEVNGHGNSGMTEVSAADLGAGKNPKLEITGGVYGGPRLPYPRSVIHMQVKH